MELIVAVYNDWGIGRDGTQPVALSADRKFFRETTRGAMVIVGRKTLADFPGGRPLPNRVNVVLSRQNVDMEGVELCHSPEEAVQLAKTAPRAMVIGGGSIYRQMLPYCDTAYVTKIDAEFPADRWFPNLDALPEWHVIEESEPLEEKGFTFRYVTYKK